MERTLLILKPDTVERKLVGKILAMVEADGFRLVRLNMARLTSEQAGSFYAEHQGKPFLKDLVDYMTSGPCIPVLLEADGAVRGIEILEYRESYGGQIREPLWRAQFIGKRHGAALTLKRDIQNISGATLSCRHIADGVKRLLATHAFVLAEH